MANPCATPITVRVWDAPRPHATDVSFYIDTDVPALSLITVEEAITDVGDEGFAVEILDGPGTGEVLLVPGDKDRSVVVPAVLCEDE